MSTLHVSAPECHLQGV